MTEKITVREDIVLIPLREEHFSYLIPWNQDDAILQWVEEDAHRVLNEEEIKNIYREACAHGKCFLILAGEFPIGECWLHEMDVPELLERYPDSRMYRMDYMIGETSYHGRGIGTDMAKALLRYGFEELDADIIWGFTKGNNMPSRRILWKLGFTLDDIIELDIRGKRQSRHHYRMLREEYAAGGRK